MVDEIETKVEKKVNTREKLDFTKIIPGMSAVDLPAQERYSMAKTQIQTAIDSKNIESLRKFSQNFYYSNGIYRRLVNYFGNLLTNDYILIPQVLEADLINTSFIKSFDAIKLYCEQAAIEDSCNQIGIILVRDGAYFGYEREMNNNIVLQQLPGNFCRSRFKMDGIYVIEFNFAYFDQYTDEKILKEVLDAFPAEFAKLYKAYQKDQITLQWQMLDYNFARAHMLENQMPMLSGIFIDLIELEDYKTIDKQKSKLALFKLIVQKIPIDKEGEISLLMEEITDLHKNARAMIKNSSVDVLTTPCEVTSIAIDDSNQNVKDDIEKGTSTVYNSAGTPIALFNAGPKAGSVGLAASIKVDEAIMLPLLKQYERWYKNRFLQISSKFLFKIMFPPLTIFNRKEMYTFYKESAALGFPTKLLAMTAMGTNQFDANFLLNYENIFLNLPTRMVPVSSSFNSGTVATTTSPGAPVSDKPLTDEGIATQDGEKNKNRV